MAACFLLPSCRTVQVVPQTSDSVRVEYRLDGVYILQHDSIFRDRWRDGDTVFVTVEKWQTKWRDRVNIQHDTICTNKVQVQTVEVVPNYYRNTSRGFWVLLAVVLLIIGYKAIKIYFHIKGL
jgi:hypothetical protein